jgi:hypothetical protein
MGRLHDIGPGNLVRPNAVRQMQGAAPAASK